jgi:hypothetical protein
MKLSGSANSSRDGEDSGNGNVFSTKGSVILLILFFKLKSARPKFIWPVGVSSGSCNDSRVNDSSGDSPFSNSSCSSDNEGVL